MTRIAIAPYAFLAASAFLFSGNASAQESYSAGQMWGTQPAGIAVPGAVESSAAHFNHGVIAGQVEAARRGLLIGTGFGESISIQTIGSQNVISTTISGSNITNSNITGEQTAGNSGPVTNNGNLNIN